MFVCNVFWNTPDVTEDISQFLYFLTLSCSSSVLIDHIITARCVGPASAPRSSTADMNK